jgi:hypothetical protein
MSLNRKAFLSFTVALLILTTARLPAPIQEVPESPTPALEQSAKPKPKRTVKPKDTTESAESSPRRQTSPGPAKSQATPNRSAFDGTWIGTLNCGLPGDVSFTLMISGRGATVNMKSSTFGSHTRSTTLQGTTAKWGQPTVGDSAWTFTPTPDGRTALVACASPGLLGIGGFSSTATFYKTSP